MAFGKKKEILGKGEITGTKIFSFYHNVFNPLKDKQNRCFKLTLTYSLQLFPIWSILTFGKEFKGAVGCKW